MVAYLKKKKLFEIAQKVFSFDCKVKLLDCEYKFYRGSEWLFLHDNTYCYEIYASLGGALLSVEKFFYDDDFKRIQISYEILNGFGVKKFVI